MLIRINLRMHYDEKFRASARIQGIVIDLQACYFLNIVYT